VPREAIAVGVILFLVKSPSGEFMASGRIDKVLAVAVNPRAYETEAIAALRTLGWTARSSTHNTRPIAAILITARRGSRQAENPVAAHR
jgi:hypothetical protein